MRQDVDADHVGETKGSGARPADGGTGKRVHFFDGQPLLPHKVERGKHVGGADAVGDEVGRVMRNHHLFAEDAVGEGS